MTNSQTFLSADSQSSLTVSSEGGKIAAQSEAGNRELSTIKQCAGTLYAAISNNRQHIAQVFEGIVHDIYMRHEKNAWNLQLQKRPKKRLKSIQWTEPEDPRYPPIDLVVTYQDGTTEHLSLPE